MRISAGPTAGIRFCGEVRDIWKEAVIEWAKTVRQDTNPSTSPTVRIRRCLSDGAPDWEGTVADMLRVIADLTDSETRQ